MYRRLLQQTLLPIVVERIEDEMRRGDASDAAHEYEVLRAYLDLFELSQLRTLSEGFARSARAKEIIEIVKRGLARDPKALPHMHSGTPLPAEKVAIVDLLRVLLKGCAARHKVAPRLIADGDDLERLAVEDAPDIAALRGWRYDMFGAQALQLKRGELALKLDRGEVVPVAIGGAAARSNDKVRAAQ